MKKIILGLFIVSTKIMCAQDTILQQNIIPPKRFVSIEQRPHFFGFSPMSRKVNKVNFAIGFGHVENKYIANQTINGLNLEFNPAPIAGTLAAFIAVLHLPDIIKNIDRSQSVGNGENMKLKNWNYSPKLQVNGLNLSTGCFFTTASMNGLNISLTNKFNNFNGFSITAIGTIIDNQNGVSVGLYNANNRLIGSTIGVFNQSYELRGIHFGLVNFAKSNRGLQIGVYNRSYSKGFQIGIWNKNAKRSFPLVNW